jgi:hypothetical protein
MALFSNTSDVKTLIVASTESMEQFGKNFKALDIPSRKAKLDQITMFLRQQNAPVEAEAFQALRCCYPGPPCRAAHPVAGLIVLGKRLTQTPVHGGKDDGVRQNLRHLARTRRQGKEHTRGQQDKQKNGDDDIKIHLYSAYDNSSGIQVIILASTRNANAKCGRRLDMAIVNLAQIPYCLLLVANPDACDGHWIANVA